MKIKNNPIFKKTVFDLSQSKKLTQKEIAKIMNITRQTVKSIENNYKERGNFERKKQKKTRRKIKLDDNFLEFIKKYATLTNKQRVEKYYEEFKIKVDSSTMCRAINAMGFTFKKKLNYIKKLAH